VDGHIGFDTPDGARIGCRVWRPPAPESGPPLLLLHGAASNGGRWWDFVEHTRLADSRRLLRPDLRGHADSRAPRPAGIDDWCADLLQLLEHERIERAVPMGHCLGANIALHFAARHPERCAAVIAVEPMLPEALYGSLARVQRFAPLIRIALALLAMGRWLGLRRRRLQAVDLRELDLRFREQLAHPEGKAAMKRRYGSPLHDLRSIHLDQYLNNLLQLLCPLPLAELRVPVLALLSSGRYLADPVRTRAGLAPVPGLDIRELPAEHWIPTEQPERLRAEVEDWLAGLD
jgi:esterase